MVNQLLKVVALTFSALIATSALAQDSRSAPLPSSITRWGLITVGLQDFYMPIPAAYPIEATGQAVGPNNNWFKAYWVPSGQTMATWTEILSLLVLPSNAPPLEVMAAQLSKSCPNSFAKSSAESPKFLVAQPNVAAAVMGCASKDNGPSLQGYYVVIHGDSNNYMLSREVRGTQSLVETAFTENQLDDLRRIFSKFAVCAKGVMCAKLK